MAFLIDAKLFAANMRYYRERQSYTIATLAHHTNLMTTVLHSLESGTHIPTEAQVAQIAAAWRRQSERASI